MALHKYFQPAQVGSLPDPRGPLSRQVPSSAISAANSKVTAVLQQPPTTRQPKRGSYAKFTPEQKADVGKRAAEHGIASTVRYYSKRLPDCPLKESSVRMWRNAYIAEIRKKRAEHSEDMSVKRLPEKRRGRPSFLGEELDRQVRAYLTCFRENGAVVNTAIAIGCAEGIVRSKDSNLLSCNGGHISLTKDWAKSLLRRMGYVKRRASTKAKVTVQDFEDVKAQFLLDIKAVAEMDEVPSELIINWDQTGIHYVPVAAWTMEKEGSKRVEIVGVDDKRQITAVFAGTLTGDFLPPQLIYKGKTPKCLPPVDLPSDWHVTFSHNHWSNESSMRDYIDKIILPYVRNKREELKLHPAHPALVIFYKFTGQGTESILTLLEENHVNVVMVPANCTDRLQPMDISVNKPAKNFLRGQFQDWYATQICQQLKVEGEVQTQAVQPVDLRLSIMKPLGASPINSQRCHRERPVDAQKC